MNLHINKINSKIQKTLRTLKGKNPKEYWKVMNSLDRNSDESCINLETSFKILMKTLPRIEVKEMKSHKYI